MGRIRANRNPKGPRGPKGTKRIAGAIMAIVLGASATSLAFASSLQLSPPTSPSFADASRCSSAEAVVTVKSGMATVAVPDECAGEDISLYLGVGNTTASVGVGTGSGTVTLPQGFTSPEGVLVTSATWPLLTNWMIEEPPVVNDSIFTCTVPQGTCEVTLKKPDYEWPGDRYRITGKITSTDIPAPPANLQGDRNYLEKNAQKWEVLINLSSPKFTFLANWLGDGQGGLVKVADSGCSAIPRTVTVKGTTTWGAYDFIWKGVEREFQVFGSVQYAQGVKLLDCR